MAIFDLGRGCVGLGWAVQGDYARKLRLCNYCLTSQSVFCGYLKVLTNEKRGGLKVIAFDRSPVKLVRFSNKSVNAPSSERPKTTQRTLFLSFEVNNCLQITA